MTLQEEHAKHGAYSNDRERIDDTYMYGCCMCLAAALHHEYGFPIVAVLYDHASGDQGLHHAWVKLPNGNHLDIRGVQSYGEIMESAKQTHSLIEIHHNIPLDLLEQVSLCELHEGEESVAEALEDARKYLADVLEPFAALTA
jgi:hypothetical protein